MNHMCRCHSWDVRTGFPGGKGVDDMLVDGGELIHHKISATLHLPAPNTVNPVSPTQGYT